MAQIIEDYCSFETAKLLKEKGFDAPCKNYYSLYTEDVKHNLQKKYGAKKNWNSFALAISRPSQSLVMKWLREEHNKIIVPGISLDDRTSSTINYYIVGIWYVPKNNGGAFCYTSPTPYGGYPSFEEACESAIKYCLEKLI